MFGLGTLCALIIVAVVALLPSLTAGQTPDSAAQLLPLPRGRFISSYDSYYPKAAARGGIEGRVLLALDIDSDGRPANTQIVFAEDPVLGEGALKLMTGIKFQVHGQAASMGRPYRLGVVFCLKPTKQRRTFDEISDSNAIIVISRDRAHRR